MGREKIALIWPDWEVEEQLGKGSYGTVYKAVRRDNNIQSHAAIKVISIPTDSSEVDSLRSFDCISQRSLEKLAETRAKWLEKALAGQKFETARCAITFRKTTKVELEDESAVIEWAHQNNRDDILKYEAPIVKKDELTRVLKAEVEVPGASLVTGLSMGVK